MSSLVSSRFRNHMMARVKSASAAAKAAATRCRHRPIHRPCAASPSPRACCRLFLSTLAFLAPINLYGDYDYTTRIRAATIGLSAFAGAAVVYANSACAWFNIMPFHTAIEVRVVDVALTFAYDASASNDMAFAIAGAVTVIVHLIPFFLLDRAHLLAFAYAGVIVNTALVVYLDSSLLLITTASALAPSPPP